MTKAEMWLEAHMDRLTGDICRLVEIPSISEPGGPEQAPFGEECAALLSCALSIGERMGFEPVNHENYCGTLLWRGQREEEIGFFGHGDVVPAGSGWTCDPFQPMVKDKMIIGRGASDNKGSFMAALYALWFLKESGYQPRYSWRFFIGTNEEKGMEDVQYYAAHYQEPVFSLVPDVTFPVCNGEKGVLELDAERKAESRVLVSFSSGIMSNAVPSDAWAVLWMDEVAATVLREKGCDVEALETGPGAVPGTKQELGTGLYQVHVKGIAAHAAFPEESESAEGKLAQLLLDSGVLDEPAAEMMKSIVRLFQDYYGAGLGVPFSDEISGKLTHVGGIASYEQGVFRQNINIRYPVTADYEAMMAQIAETMAGEQFTLTKVHNSAPCYVSADSAPVQKLVEVCRRHLDMDLQPFVMGGGTYARKLKRAVGFGPGIPGKEKRFGTERGGAHQPDEYVELEHLKKAFLIYVDAILELDQMDEF